MRDSLVFIESQVVVEKEEELLLHEVDLRRIEHTTCIVSPMFVFGCRIVEVFASHNERR